MSESEHPVEQFQASVALSLEQLDRLESHTARVPSPYREPLEVLTTSMRSNLQLMAAVAGVTLGECRMATPFASIQPIIDTNGSLRWCCTHSPQHYAP